MESHDGDTQPPRAIKRRPVVIGIGLGFVLAIFVQALLITHMGQFGLEQTRRSVYAIYWVPTLLVIGPLLSRRTRRIGAGLVLGVCIGTILTAGGCTFTDVGI